jgi:8-oxo-dGTP pyrophosphatase MutT (NUDIX family)
MNAAGTQWLARQLDRPPQRPRSALALAQADAGAPAVIGSIEPALARRLAGAGLPLREAGAAWQIHVPEAAAVDPLLARIARWLHEHDAADAWRDECLAVVDDAGAVHGAIERAAARPLGLATCAVHLVVHDGGGRVSVQQRAFDKATDPGRWDTTVGGLVAAGESVAQTLARETWEEAGLRIESLPALADLGRCTVRRPVQRGFMVERIEMFEAVAPPGAMPVNRDGEVACFECIDAAALAGRLQAQAFTLEASAVLLRWWQRRTSAGGTGLPDPGTS